MKLLRFKIDKVVQQLDILGGVSFPIMKRSLRMELYAKAIDYHYIPREREVGPHKVHQDMSAVDSLPLESIFYEFRDAWQKVVRETLASRGIFSGELFFNELILQRYEAGSIGISAHLDPLCYRNLICIFNLSGNGTFFITETRESEVGSRLSVEPGNVVLLRAPGYRNTDFRPFHSVRDVVGPRYTFGLRQDSTKPAF